MLKIVILLFCVFNISFSLIIDKPKFLKTCDYNGDDFTQCMTSSVQSIFTELITGIEGLESIGTIEPFKLNKIKVADSNKDGPVTVDATLTKVTIAGFKDIKVIENKISKKDLHWDATVFLPKIKIEGNLKVKGRILVIPLDGSGKCLIEPSNMRIKVNIKSHLYERDGHKFFNMTSTRVKYTMEGLKLNFENLFNGNKELEDSTNTFVNQNWRISAEALQPVISRTIEDILLDIMQKVFAIMPADYFVKNLP